MQATHLLFFRVHLYSTAKQLQGGASITAKTKLFDR